ncbi:MAG: sulfatase-like hydrolase/transferase [Planctomycetaceae bacterium]
MAPRQSPGHAPAARGFDEFFGFQGGARSYFEKAGILRGTELVNELDYTTDAFGREASTFIDQHNNQPWFLYLSFNAVHTPMHATDDRLSKFSNVADKQRRIYNAMMLAMDDAIGQVRTKLVETGQADNTLIAFISDNGGPAMAGVSVNGSNNAPLRGSKRTTLEGGIRVPYVITWPGHIKPGVFEHSAIQLDLHATALAAAGVDAKPEWKLDGVSLLPFLSGEKTDAPHDALYWRFGRQMAIRSGDWKLVRYDSHADTQSRQAEPVTAAKLYNLATDIHEDQDLSAMNPDKVRELQASWDAWDLANVAPLWGGGNEGGRKQNAAKSGKKKRKNAP